MNDEYYYYDYEQIDNRNYDADLYDEILLKLNDENSFIGIWNNCLQPSLYQVLKYIFKLIGWNCLCRLGWILIASSRSRHIPPYGEHLVSLFCGTFCLYQIIDFSIYYLLGFCCFSYLILHCLYKLTNNQIKPNNNNNRIGFIFGGLCIISLVICELLQINIKIWHQIRGIQMIATMKAVSIAFDLDSTKLLQLPNFFQYIGYIMCPGNCVLGPWIPFQEYMAIFNDERRSKYNFKWLIWILTNSICAIVFVLISNCLISVINYESLWINAYKDAFSFRNSHYFISFLSQATMAAAGLINTDDPLFSFNNDKSSKFFGYMVTKPWNIELPRSLVEIVINWNIPMHRWLKLYVFNVIKPYSIPLSLFITYLISSLLHGLNFQLYAVLLSLGFYTYVEYNLRYKLSIILNCCILSIKCKRKCKHLYKSNTVRVYLINFIFSLLTCLHLAYLGVIFESSTQLQEEGYSIEHAINKWKSLNFLSLLIVIVFYVINLLIRIK